ncbi:Vps53-like protein [Chiua virens]|nr:Vps53-like protein [Chiua virens]
MQRRPADAELPQELVLAIHRILELNPEQHDDPLDVISNDFDPVDVLNQLFPDGVCICISRVYFKTYVVAEASLARLDAVQAKLAQDERDIQAEVGTLQEALKRDQDPGRMQLIQETISDLLGQMSRIREKASESEAVVRNITKDIQALDLAKKNLIRSMTTLKRLQMLVNALTQLEEQVKEKKYAEVAHSLAAVKQLSASFKSYTSVHRIMQVWKRIQQVQGEIRTQLDAEFDSLCVHVIIPKGSCFNSIYPSFLLDLSKPVKTSQIPDACAVVDVLGPDVRTQLIERYVALELKEYRRIFRASDEAGHLDNIARRFAWFRRLLTSYETEIGKVFPAEWRVGWWLFAKFVSITRDDLSSLLSKAGQSLTVKLLLEALQQTTEFETSIEKKWATPVYEILKAASPSAAQAQSMSSAFEPHLGIFVDAQDKALTDMLAPHRGSKARGSIDTTSKPPTTTSTPRASLSAPDEPEPAPIVLPSSTELFYFYAQSLDQCAKLSIGQAFFDLCSVQKKWLKIYAGSPQIQSRKSMDSRFDKTELQQACLLINTADYCQTTAAELEEKIKEKIGEKFKEKVTLQTERDLFMSVVSAAINVQLHELEIGCDGAFNTMSRVNWGAMNHVTGHSAFMDDITQATEQVTELIKPLVEQKKYLRNFFDKASSLLLMRFTNALVKNRPLKEIGAEQVRVVIESHGHPNEVMAQLLIDLGVFKSCLLKLPGEALSTASYTRSLTKVTTRLEALLKVIITPVDPPEGFILNYTLVIGDASFSNFQKILDLKGTPKTEQNSLLDLFLTITSTKTDLESTSFLTSLDMDPPTTLAVGSPATSRIALPLSSTSAAAESMFGALTSPPLSGPPTGSSNDGGSTKGNESGQKREVFSDIRRFVTFGLRRETPPS